MLLEFKEFIRHGSKGFVLEMSPMFDQRSGWDLHLERSLEWEFSREREKLMKTDKLL